MLIKEAKLGPLGTNLFMTITLKREDETNLDAPQHLRWNFFVEMPNSVFWLLAIATKRSSRCYSISSSATV